MGWEAVGRFGEGRGREEGLTGLGNRVGDIGNVDSRSGAWSWSWEIGIADLRGYARAGG